MLRKEDRIRTEFKVDSEGQNRKGYIHACKECGREKWIRPDYERYYTGYCQICEPTVKHRNANLANPTYTNNEGILVRKCLTCTLDLPLKDFPNNKDYANKCKKCITLNSYFGINNKDYQNILQNQNFVCAICKNPETVLNKKTKQIKNLCLDHCHTTMDIRGLLCNACNTGLGSFKDNTIYLEEAIKYLKKENTLKLIRKNGKT